jgi:hypothetical protein
MPQRKENRSSVVPSPSSYGLSTRLRVRVQGIGELAEVGYCWRLTYDQCGHIQEFALLGLEDPQQAVLQVSRYYTGCLTCRLEKRQSAFI